MTARSLNEIIREGEWEKLKHNPEYQNLPAEKKILAAKQTVNNKLAEADTVFRETIREDLKSAKIIMDKRIKPLRNLVKALNACYAGNLNDDEAKHMNTLLGITAAKKG